MGHGASTLCSTVETRDQSGLTAPTKSTISAQAPVHKEEGDLKDASQSEPNEKTDQLPNEEEESREEDANRSQTDQLGLIACCETNQHAHDSHDQTIPPVGDLIVDQPSEDELGITNEANNTAYRTGLKNNSPLETEKPNSPWSEDAGSFSHSPEKVKSNFNPLVTFKAGDLNLGDNATEFHPIIVEQPNSPTDKSPSMIAPEAQGENDKVMCNGKDETKAPYSVSDLVSSNETEKTVDVLEQPVSGDEKERDSSLLPMSPDDFASHQSKTKQPLVTAIKLPEVSDVITAVHQAITVKSPTVTQKLNQAGDDPDNTQYSDTMDICCWTQGPRSHFTHTLPIMVNRRVSRFVRTRDAGTLVAAEKLDAQTSMYVCAEASQSDSQNIIPEIADLTTASWDGKTPLSSLALEPHREKLISQNGNLETKQVPDLSDCVPLPIVHYGQESGIKLDEDLTVPISDSEATLPKGKEKAQASLDQHQQLDGRGYPIAQVEKVSSYTDASTECPLTSGDDNVEDPVSKYSMVGVQTETVIIVDDESYTIEGPYNVDQKREGVLRTPSLAEVQAHRASVAESLMGGEPSTMPVVPSMDTSVSPKESRKLSFARAKRTEEPDQCEKQFAELSPNADTKSPVQVERIKDPEEEEGVDNVGRCSDCTTPVTKSVLMKPDQNGVNHGASELTDFLQVVQSADDFEILADETTITEKPDIPQLKAGTKERPQCTVARTDKQVQTAKPVVEQQLNSTELNAANRNANNAAEESKQMEESDTAIEPSELPDTNHEL